MTTKMLTQCECGSFMCKSKAKKAAKQVLINTKLLSSLIEAVSIIDGVENFTDEMREFIEDANEVITEAQGEIQ